ncbi:RNase H domain-containing protein [Trichonephila clavipes]|nr:RNase H domain-containing protein [Trichonephila clavipes]
MVQGERCYATFPLARNHLGGRLTKAHACCIKNSDHCSVFRSELIAISGALNSNNDSILILTDSKSSIQYLKNWPKIMDSTGIHIISKLARLGQRKQVCFQWIPSHEGVPENEAADKLAGKDWDLFYPSSCLEPL